MTEPEYLKWLRALEGDPVFALLRNAPGRAVIRREPTPGAKFAWPHSGVDADAVAAPLTSLGLPGFDEETVGLVRRLGLETFERVFLRGDDPAQRAAAATAAGFSRAQAEKVARLVDELAFLEDRGAPGSPAPGAGALQTASDGALPATHCVASIERGQGGYVVAYFSTHYLRGRYRVDYAALSAFRDSHSEEQWGRARDLIRQLELANRKLSALGRILESIPLKQSAYLATGDPEQLLPLRQNAVARELGLSPSSICRALAGRSVRTPQGREVALSSLFPSTRARTERLIALVSGALPSATDEQVRRELEARHGVRVTRRLVNLRRRRLEAGTPASGAAG